MPTVLFSATPFRGDLKLFDVDDEHIYFLSFRQAVSEGLIRGVQIDERKLSHKVEEFARAVIDGRDELIQAGNFRPRARSS